MDSHVEVVSLLLSFEFYGKSQMPMIFALPRFIIRRA